MSIVRGENCIVEFYDGGEWKPYACARSCSLTTQTELIETSVKGSGKFKHFMPMVNSFTGNIEGLTYLEKPGFLTLYNLRNFQLSHVLQRTRFTREDEDGNLYIDTVDFFITNVTDTSSFDNVSTFSVELQGTGVLGQTIIEPPVIITKVKRSDTFTAVGGELSFTDTAVINKDIIEVVKGKLSYEVIITSGSPGSDEVLYDSATGTFTFPVEFDANEKAYCTYQDM